jgi:acetyl esterase/lipase
VHSYIAAYLPSTSESDRRKPDISPFYANLRELRCPPAIFTCGTLDPLLDDSVLMATKWTMSGADAVLKLYPGMLNNVSNGLLYQSSQSANLYASLGAAHGFVFFPIGGTPETQKALDDIKAFLQERL